MPGSTSSILNYQLSLYNQLDKNINIYWATDKQLIATNINETKVDEMAVATSKPSNNSNIYLDAVDVYFNNDFTPSGIGNELTPIIRNQIMFSNKNAYYNGEPNFQPFINGIGDATGVNDLVNKLGKLNPSIGDVTTYKKKYFFSWMTY